MMNRNRKFIMNITGDALMIYGAFLLPSFVLSVICGEMPVTRGVGFISALCILGGFYARQRAGKIEAQVRPRIWYMTTFFTWIMLIALTVPVFYTGMPQHSVIDALFEASASWTTTGAGIYDSASMPYSLKLVRATCNWLGGVGIIMTILSLVPTRQFLGYGLVSTEFPGPSFLKSGDPFRKGYRMVVLVYILFTMTQFILLALAGMPEFTSLLTALSNTSTAGLRHIDNGMAVALPMRIKIIITVFAFLGSVNCTVFLFVMERRPKAISNLSELKMYCSRILVTSLILAGLIYIDAPGRDLLRTLGDVLMQVISFFSTSGYLISDCGRWPDACAIIILIQMFIGSCAVSTGGGIKEARIIIAVKTISLTIYKHIHPSSVRTLTFNRKPLTNDQIVRANLFIVLFMIFFLGGALMLSLDTISVADALNYSQAMLTNTGTSIGELSKPATVANFSAFSKIVMCLQMIAGRLEIYPFIMIFLRNFWKSDSAV